MDNDKVELYSIWITPEYCVKFYAPVNLTIQQVERFAKLVEVSLLHIEEE